jgi:hypothetical protein
MDKTAAERDVVAIPAEEVRRKPARPGKPRAKVPAKARTAAGKAQQAGAAPDIGGARPEREPIVGDAATAAPVSGGLRRYWRAFRRHARDWLFGAAWLATMFPLGQYFLERQQRAEDHVSSQLERLGSRSIAGKSALINSLVAADVDISNAKLSCRDVGHEWNEADGCVVPYTFSDLRIVAPSAWWLDTWLNPLSEAGPVRRTGQLMIVGMDLSEQEIEDSQIAAQFVNLNLRYAKILGSRIYGTVEGDLSNLQILGSDVSGSAFRASGE